MLLKLYLEQLSPSILKKILGEHEENLKINTPNEIVDYLNNYLVDFNNIQEIYKRMTEEEKEVIAYFILQIPNEALTYHSLNNFKGKISRNQFESGINKLNNKGIIFVIKKGWGNIAFIIPQDLFIIWHKFFLYDVINKQKEISENVSGNYTHFDLLDENLYRLLASLQIEPISIARGSSKSKYLKKLAESINLKNSDIASFPFKNQINYGDKQLNDLKNLSFLLEVANLLELIEPENEFTITSNTLSWHNLDKVKRRDFIEKAVCSCFKSSDLLIRNLFYLIYNIPNNRLLSFNDLVKNLSDKLHRPFGKEILLRGKKEVLDPLTIFGWIERIEDGKDHFLFKRIPNEGEETTQIYVQPNFEILVPYDFPHSIRIKIEQFSTLVQHDFLNRYTLTRDSILKGLERGSSKEEIIVLLKKYSSNQINNNIIQAVSDWAESYGQVSFFDVRMMECSSKTIVAAIKNNESFKKWIIAEISPTKFIVYKSNYDELIKELNINGIFPKKEIWDENQKISSKDKVFEEDYIGYSGVYRYKDFDIENKLEH